MPKGSKKRTRTDNTKDSNKRQRTDNTKDSNKRQRTDNTKDSNKPSGIDSWDTNFEVTYKIKTIGINQESVYKKTKELITEAMNKICREEAANNRALALSDPNYKAAPDFKPKVKFNDRSYTIDIGGDYSGFFTMVLENTSDTNTFYDYFPHPTERGILGIDPVSTRTQAGKLLKVFSTDTQSFLFSQKDSTTPVAYKPHHPFLQEGVKRFQEQAESHLKNKAKINLPKDVTRDNLMDHLSKEGHKRFSFGEQHDLPEFRQWLIKNMSHFSGGYIVLEGFFYEHHYKAFQEWQQQPKGTPLPYELKHRAKLAHNIENVLIAANENGVTIIPGDDENTYVGSDISSTERTEFMDYQLVHIIQEHVPTNKPLAIVSGLLHCTDRLHFNETDRLRFYFNEVAPKPGVGRGVPDVISIAMLPLDSHPESVMTNKSFNIGENRKFYADILVNTGEKPTNLEYNLINMNVLDPPHEAGLFDVDDVLRKCSEATIELLRNSNAPDTEHSSWYVDLTHVEKKQEKYEITLKNTKTDETRTLTTTDETFAHTQTLIEEHADTVKIHLEKKGYSSSGSLETVNKGVNVGMTIFGLFQAINSFKKGDKIGGTFGAIGAGAGALGIMTEKFLNNANKIFKSATPLNEFATRISESGTHIAQSSAEKILTKESDALLKVFPKFVNAAKVLRKVLPGIGLVVSAYAVYEDGKAIAESVKTGSVRGIVKGSIDIFLDETIGITSVIPEFGTAVSLGLVLVRLISDNIIDQAFDPDAYQKTWEVLKEPNATWVDKGTASVLGTVQFLWKYTLIGQSFSAWGEARTLDEKVQKQNEDLHNHEFTKEHLKNFLAISDEKGLRILDFDSPSLSTYAGGLEVRFLSAKTALVTAGSLKKPLHVSLGERPVAELVIKMGEGAAYTYNSQKQSSKFWGIPVHSAMIATSATLDKDSLTSHYYAPQDGTNMVFLGPDHDPTAQKTALPAGAQLTQKDFHYLIEGGTGTTTYYLKGQNAVVKFVAGVNIVHIAFKDQTASRAIVLEGYKEESSHVILDDMMTNSPLFKHAKITAKILNGRSDICMKFGGTTIGFASLTAKQLQITTNDGLFLIKTQRLITDVQKSFRNQSEVEFNFTDYVDSSIFGYKNTGQIIPVQMNKTFVGISRKDVFVIDCNNYGTIIIENFQKGSKIKLLNSKKTFVELLAAISVNQITINITPKQKLVITGVSSLTEDMFEFEAPKPIASAIVSISPQGTSASHRLRGEAKTYTAIVDDSAVIDDRRPLSAPGYFVPESASTIFHIVGVPNAPIRGGEGYNTYIFKRGEGIQPKNNLDLVIVMGSGRNDIVIDIQDPPLKPVRIQDFRDDGTCQIFFKGITFDSLLRNLTLKESPDFEGRIPILRLFSNNMLRFFSNNNEECFLKFDDQDSITKLSQLILVAEDGGVITLDLTTRTRDQWIKVENYVKRVEFGQENLKNYFCPIEKEDHFSGTKFKDTFIIHENKYGRTHIDKFSLQEDKIKILSRKIKTFDDLTIMYFRDSENLKKDEAIITFDYNSSAKITDLPSGSKLRAENFVFVPTSSTVYDKKISMAVITIGKEAACTYFFEDNTMGGQHATPPGKEHHYYAPDQAEKVIFMLSEGEDKSNSHHAYDILRLVFYVFYDNEEEKLRIYEELGFKIHGGSGENSYYLDQQAVIYAGSGKNSVNVSFRAHAPTRNEVQHYLFLKNFRDNGSDILRIHGTSKDVFFDAKISSHMQQKKLLVELGQTTFSVLPKDKKLTKLFILTDDGEFVIDTSTFWETSKLEQAQDAVNKNLLETYVISATYGYHNLESTVLPIDANNTFKGSCGKNTFIIDGKNYGRTTIENFSVTKDKIKVTNSKFSQFSELKLENHEGDTWIYLNPAHILILQGVKSEHVTAENFKLEVGERFSLVTINLGKQLICSYTFEDGGATYSQELGRKDSKRYYIPENANKVVIKIKDDQEIGVGPIISLGRNTVPVEVICCKGKNLIDLEVLNIPSESSSLREMRVKIVLPEGGFFVLNLQGIRTNDIVFQQARIGSKNLGSVHVKIGGKDITFSKASNAQGLGQIYFRTGDGDFIFNTGSLGQNRRLNNEELLLKDHIESAVLPLNRTPQTNQLPASSGVSNANSSRRSSA